MAGREDLPHLSNSEGARREWETKYRDAAAFMKTRPSSGRVLLEIAAQHPLVDARFPNEEFTARLHRGVELYHSYIQQGMSVEIYVPGSRHMFDGVSDAVSLSRAGSSFLIENGIPGVVVHGDDLNHRYKEKEGVYGSADECFVASSFFKSSDFEVLGSVVSPGQLMRKTLHYIAFGVLPLCYTVPVKHAFHDYIHEIFDEIPYVLYVDDTLQDADSEKAKLLRQQRRPKDSS